MGKENSPALISQTRGAESRRAIYTFGEDQPQTSTLRIRQPYGVITRCRGI
jgi:hypothetical protein